MLIEAGAFDTLPGPAPTDAQAATPYPGLRPFSERDSRLFFGRERETASLLEMLENQQLVVVHGASGCGKSSLVRAGLLPVFRMDAAANSKQAYVVIVRPADEGGPLQSLARKLDQELKLASLSEGDQSVEPISWSTILTTSADWLKDIGERVEIAGGALCILFDQFEEIFAASKAGHAAQVHRVIEFLNSLSQPSPEGTALGGRSISVVVTMRSDYLGNCAVWEGFAETVNRCQYLLPRISTLGLLRAIHQPARIAGGQVEQPVADHLLCVVKSEMDGLPIVQHALSRAWQWSVSTRNSRNVDTESMAAVGGAGCALSNHADEVFAEATGGDADLENAADWMLRSLSDLDTDGRIIRRSIPFEQLAREGGGDRRTIGGLLGPFRNPANSLIMPPSSEELHDSTIISVSHEALLRQWKRISETAFDERGRTTGLAYREVQDGMIWRALSVQAQQFAEDGTSILGPAATEQRLPWYSELAQRPGWIARHEMQAWSPTQREVQQHWKDVADLMEASERNLEAEEQKLQRERELVGKLRHSRNMLWWLSVAVIALVLLITVPLILDWQGKLAEQKRTAAVAERRAKVEFQAKLYRADIDTANFVAQKFCSGRAEGAAVTSCVTEQKQKYLQEIRTTKSKDEGKLPASPLGGGIGPVVPQGDSK